MIALQVFSFPKDDPLLTRCSTLALSPDRTLKTLLTLILALPVALTVALSMAFTDHERCAHGWPQCPTSFL